MLSVSSFTFKREHFFLGAILVVAAYLGYDKRFIQDDAYISFIYARNFAEGHGLVWTPGSNEYGYTSVLFTLLVGILMKFGLAPEMAAALISFPAMLITIPLVFGMCRRLTHIQIVPWAISALLATNHTFLAYGTGGLETSLRLCLVFGAYYHVLNWKAERQTKQLIWVALLSAVALFTRLDSALMLFPAYALLLWELIKHGKDTRDFRTPAITFLWLTAIPTVAVCALLAFGHFTYGFAFPTTYYAKLDGWYVLDGLGYIYAFIKAQYYVPAILLFAWFVLVKEEHLEAAVWRGRILVGSYLFIWLLYILHTGGDFMEFRFILPILPFFYLFIFDLMHHVDRTKAHIIFKAAIILAFIGNFMQPYYFYKSSMDKNFIESTTQLNSWIVDGKYNWTFLGKKLNEFFYTGSENDVKIAVTGSGAIPYYAQLPTIDRHGLNTRDVFIPQNNIEHIDRPGHRVKAKIAYLTNLKVNLILDHPVFVRKVGGIFICQPAPMKISHEHLINITPVFIHLDRDMYVMAHYLVRHPAIEKMLKDGAIVPHKMVRAKTRCGDKFIIPGFQTPKSS